MRSSELTGATGITADSRAVQPGYIFAALPGAKADGRGFIADAVTRGAVAVLADETTIWPPGVPPRPLYRAANPRARLAELAVELAGRMPEKLIAVTGTNGKTSTVDFLRQILNLSGVRAASLGTLGLIAPDHAPDKGSLTTPDPVSLANTLAGLAAENINHVALEASSHGLDQNRLDGLRFTAAGFTNLTRDHLDYHGNLASYRAAKLRLFSALVRHGAPIHAMADLDPETLQALQEITHDRGLAFHTVTIGECHPLPSGQDITIAGRKVFLPLPGRFQVDNAALAAALAESLGVRHALDHLVKLRGVRGRLERALTLPSGASAYVDYAHTPDAIARLLTALRPHASGRLIIVFGAGGDRDAGKRPLMAAQAASLADQIIITDDNPRRENPAAIRAQVRAGAPHATEIADRRAAIAAGLNELRTGDVLVVAGKGHEQGQIIGSDILPFDDIAVLRDLGGLS